MPAQGQYTGQSISEDQKAVIAAMVEADYNQLAIADTVGTSDKMVRSLSRAGIGAPPALIAALKKGLGDKFALKADTFLESIDAGKLEKMTAYQAIVAAGIAVDKMLLLDGKPTQIHAVALFQGVMDDQAALRDELNYMAEAIDVTPESCI